MKAMFNHRRNKIYIHSMVVWRSSIVRIYNINDQHCIVWYSLIAVGYYIIILAGQWFSARIKRNNWQSACISCITENPKTGCGLHRTNYISELDVWMSEPQTEYCFQNQIGNLQANPKPNQIILSCVLLLIIIVIIKKNS